MGKAEYGTAKYLSNQLKVKGLQKLKFYCQVCRKQCRDENGFKSHIRSPFHLKNISQVTTKDIEDYTEKFENDFLKLLKMTHGEKKIEANKFYNQFIQDKEHIHMNATTFTSLTRFIKHLSKEGKIRVHGVEELEDDMDPGRLLISFIDNSYENVLRKEKLVELEKGDATEQEIKKKLLDKQIEMGKKLEEQKIRQSDDEEETPTPRVVENVKVSLKLSKPAAKGKVAKKKNVFKKK